MLLMLMPDYDAHRLIDIYAAALLFH